MPASVATLLLVGFSVWLIIRDGKKFNSPAALWIPLIWVFILASKPISFWLGLRAYGTIEDPTLDKVIYFSLLLCGLVILSRRRLDWRNVLASNKWLFLFFLYLAVSVVWSGDPFVAFKRWVKDAGNIVMALVILSEEDLTQAVRTVFARCAYLLIPLSVLLVKYYPNISRRYGVFDFQPRVIGSGLDKNMFGMALFICMLTLCWLYLEFRDTSGGKKDRTTTFIYVVLMLMTVWLLDKAQSATAEICTLIGGGIVFGLRFNGIKAQVKRLGLYAAAAVFLVLIFKMVGLSDVIFAEFTRLAGRDPTLHGRTEIWDIVLKEDINPLLGAGYSSFWSEERNRRLSVTYSYLLGEAHNGYLETYLNNGIIGLCLLMAMLLSAANRIRREIYAGLPFGPLWLAFMITGLFYGFSEAAYNRLQLLWFVVILVSLNMSRLSLQDRGVKVFSRFSPRSSIGLSGKNENVSGIHYKNGNYRTNSEIRNRRIDLRRSI